MNRSSGGMGEAGTRTLDGLLVELLELDEPQRGARLAALPTAQREALTSLLSAALEPDDFLQPGRALHPELIEQAMTTSGEALKPGTQLGPYRVLREIGAGGMGRVYLAERADGLFSRQVAIKLLPPPDAGTDPERLQREQRLLASLRHPHIAQLYDAGVSAKGAPYLVMEHIEGEPIDDFCRREGLDAKARLRMVMQVCEAVQAAHQQLIVHRDIKPSNILVAPGSVVKLLDFGIARLVRDEPGASVTSGLSASPLAQDRTHDQSALTPRYASPEQRAGAAAGTASDIYQIGLLLWELLTRQRPREDTEPDPLPPVAGLPQDDLQAVIAKTLAAQPDDRYATVDRLREDLEHLLQGRPVSARPPTRAYVLRRFVTRHRGGVAVGLLSVAAILAGVAGTIWQAHRAERQAQLAQEQAARAEAVRDYLQSVLFSLVPSTPELAAPPKERVVEEALKRAEQELAAQPQLLAEVRLMLARLDERLGLYERATQTAEAAHIALQHRFGDMHPATARAAVLLGNLQRSAHDNDVQAIEAQLRRALETLQQVDAPKEVQVEALLALAALHSEIMESESSLQGLDRARALRAADGAAPLALAEIDFLRARQFDRLTRFEEALQAFDAALVVYETELGNVHADTAEVLSDSGAVLVRADQLEAGIQRLERARDINAQVYLRPTDASLQTLLDLAKAYASAGRLDAALATAGAQIDGAEQVFGAHHTVRASGLHERAIIHLRAGTHTAALDDIDASLEILRKVYGQDHARVAVGQALRGSVLMRLGRLAEAEAALQETSERYLALFGAQSTRYGSAMTQLGHLQLLKGDASIAQRSFAEARAVYAASYGPQHSWTLTLGVLEAEALQQDGQVESALTELDLVQAPLIEAVGENNATSARALRLRARLLCAAGFSGDCLDAAARALAATEAVHGAEHESSHEMRDLIESTSR